jgi:16S rRNA (uracil1498-N3)-methyltransferase
MNIILFENLPMDNHIPSSDFRGEHIIKVLRLSQGDSFILGEIGGWQGKATITSISKEGVSYVWEALQDSSSLYPVTLLVAQVRPICMKRILREAVSLGVSQIIVTGAESAEKSYQSAKLWTTGEFQKYLLDGAMQAGGTGLSKLHLVSCIEDAIRDHGTWQQKILLDNVLTGDRLSNFPYSGGSVVLAVGPERGWTQRERQIMIAAGFTSYTLGSRILRTETASSVGLGLLLSRMGIL